MAKLVDVSYGSDGNPKKGLYTYVVNDDVRVGQFLNVSVTHPVSGKVYGTTAISQKEYENGSKSEKNKIEELQHTQKVVVGKDGYAQIVEGVTPKKVYDAKDAGMPDAGLLGRNKQGKFVSKSGGLGTKAVYNEETGRYEARAGKKYEWNETVEQIRQYNVEKNQDAQQTFDEYSKNFLSKGE
jgi:hypothetical protein